MKILVLLIMSWHDRRSIIINGVDDPFILLFGNVVFLSFEKICLSTVQSGTVLYGTVQFLLYRRIYSAVVQNRYSTRRVRV